MQVNSCGHENTRRVLSANVNAAMGVEACSNKLYYRVVRDTATDMKAAKINNVEDRRVQWTTHKNFRDARIKGNHSTSIAPHLVGLTTFGGVDPTSGHEVKISAFKK